ncbi:hypothetical protein M0804_011291 [Polistes exclamans]|nr:hypothetical protein M0804_011291 [Polistes exclamans]
MRDDVTRIPVLRSLDKLAMSIGQETEFCSVPYCKETEKKKERNKERNKEGSPQSLIISHSVVRECIIGEHYTTRLASAFQSGLLFEDCRIVAMTTRSIAINCSMFSFPQTVTVARRQRQRQRQRGQRRACGGGGGGGYGGGCAKKNVDPPK